MKAPKKLILTISSIEKVNNSKFTLQWTKIRLFLKKMEQLGMNENVQTLMGLSLYPRDTAAYPLTLTTLVPSDADTK